MDHGRQKILWWLVIGLWLVGSFFLLGGFSRIVYLNGHVDLAIAQVVDSTANNGAAWVNLSSIVLTDSGTNERISQWVLVDIFPTTEEAQIYLDQRWPLGSFHACYVDPFLRLSISIYLEYWSLIVAALLLVASTILVSIILGHQCYLRYKRLNYAALPGDKDFVLISAKDLDSMQIAESTPLTSGRSAMTSFEEAQALLWRYKHKVIAQLGLDKFFQLRDDQIKAIMGTEAQHFQFQQDLEAVLVQLV